MDMVTVILEPAPASVTLDGKVPTAGSLTALASRTATTKGCATCCTTPRGAQTVAQAGWVQPATMCVSMEHPTVTVHSATALQSVITVWDVTSSVQEMVFVTPMAVEAAIVTL
ncbi:hypothetical protein DPMN_003922 [Dreissena polymorpha]|uniref:Uncharacterized protein n=1 Tax=Dreissena polymorpha TaxID=45954 RepID=A0A9D4MMG7_DREPO|nr:hypothetical protein DPMN_003922 [Dreissena polymorpha]